MKLSKPIILSLVLATFFGVANAQESKVDLTSEKAKLGYTLGVQIASDLLRGGLKEEIDMDAFLAAQSDIMSGGESQMTPEEMQATQQAFQLKQQQAYAAVLAENKAKGDAYLEENKSKKGVKITESGLQYEVLREGKGAQPTAESSVNVHYKGTLITGQVFDSSYDRNQAADFPVGGVIPGFSEGLQLMKEGAQYRFTIPSEIAYGEQGPATIGPNQVLIFEVELNEVK
ncbi:MAG: FKBP-type peptidyl-prolyl cis-trans isomerase [Acidiferrobacterales bacterium]|nr:FKBP-type peptidyl-prolyl cis-trans isomerase [Acidiferrobacterales bacterium]